MTTKKKTTKRSSSRGIHNALDRLERDLPPNLSRLVKQIRRSMLDLEKQLEKTRREGEQRWARQQTEIRRDIAALLRRLEKAVEPPKKRTRKAPSRKAASAASSAS